MAGNHQNRFPTDKNDVARIVSATIDSFIRDCLINRDERTRHKEQCAERLAAEDEEEEEEGREVSYSDQAVLANLDWGIEAVEEALETSHAETKLARLDHAEKMLKLCAMLSTDRKTAGVPNLYLSAWAHLYLAYLWKMRNNVRNSARHALEMFTIDPFFSRIDFAPELWKDLFLPHMGSIVGRYSEERRRLVVEAIPDSADLSFTIDVDESLILGPDQADKLWELERVFGESLDENTRLFAKYFKDCLSSDSSFAGKVVPMPIAEPPMTPMHELSRSIPDFVKFGPTLPKSAGFSLLPKSKDDNKETNRHRSRTTAVSPASQKSESGRLDSQEGLPEEKEEESDYEEQDSVNVDSDDEAQETSSHSSNNKARQISQQPSKIKSVTHSPTVFSPLCSPKSSPPILSSPKPEAKNRSEPITLLRLKSIRLTDSPTATSLPVSPSLSNGYTNSSVDSDGEGMSQQSCSKKLSPTPQSCETFKYSSLNDDNDGSQSRMSLPPSEKITSKLRPPKDFVCPITGQIFCDPVTLETGQTYEKKAIWEWLKRGNKTCPITRQSLSATVLPKTNYVLKRLISSWREQIPDLSQEFHYSEISQDKYSHFAKNASLASTPTNEHANNKKIFSTAVICVISQAEVDKIINSIKPHISCLCTSEILRDCETAVLEISRLWKDSKGDPTVRSCLSDPTIVNSFAEILSASLNRDVLRTSIYILSEMISMDESIGEVLTSTDSDLDCLAELLKNGLAEAAVLLCQLRPPFSQLSAHDLVPSLVQLMLSKRDESDDLPFLMVPKDAAMAMLEQILVGGDDNSRAITASSLISANGIHVLVKLLDGIDGRRSVVSILLCCMQVEKSCRAVIANRVEVSLVLELFHDGNDSARGLCVGFLSELVRLNRRTLSNQILQRIKDDGTFSTKHSFLVYLQIAPMEQRPAISSLLLQIDLLVEPLKMSIFREEAIEALIEALRANHFPDSQFMALDSLSSLIGRITSSGDSYTEAWLLKIAGFDQPYNAVMKAEQTLLNHDADSTDTTEEEEEKAMSTWERRLAYVLCNHERGSIFKALEECLKSSSLEMAKACLVIATWLTYVLSILPDTGVKISARKSLLNEFINVLISSKNRDEKTLATLALKTFIDDKDATRAMGMYAKCIYKTLKKLKRNSVEVSDIMKALRNLASVDPTELWTCTELVELDLCMNGEVLSLVHLRGRVLSSHSDGTIKVWEAGKRVPRLVQEVREHSKAVTCLYASPSGDKLYSGSLDKTIRVWTVKPEEIRCVQVHDVKEAVHDLAANGKTACFVSQGTGVKIYNWSGTPKQVSFNKYVKCLALSGNKLYCGCSGYSIQEVDLSSYTSSTFYSRTRKLLGKQTIYSLQIRDGILFAGGSSVDSTAGKIFLMSTKEIIGSFPSGLDIQRIDSSNEFIFTATKCGDIEVWLKESFAKVASIKMSSSSGQLKITSLTSDTNGGMLYAGYSDGKIQVWSLD